MPYEVLRNRSSLWNEVGFISIIYMHAVEDASTICPIAGYG